MSENFVERLTYNIIVTVSPVRYVKEDPIMAQSDFSLFVSRSNLVLYNLEKNNTLKHNGTVLKFLF